MLSVNTEIPERKQGFTATSCTHSQDLPRPGASLSPVWATGSSLPGLGRTWYRASSGTGNWTTQFLCLGWAPFSACHHWEVNSYWLLNKWLHCVGVRGLFPHTLPVDKHVLTEQLHTNPLGEILHIVPQAADKWNSYSTCKHNFSWTEVVHLHKHKTQYYHINADVSRETRSLW